MPELMNIRTSIRNWFRMNVVADYPYTPVSNLSHLDHADYEHQAMPRQEWVADAVQTSPTRIIKGAAS